MFAVEQLSCSWQMVHHVHYSILYCFVLLFRAVNSFVTNVQQASFGSQGSYKHMQKFKNKEQSLGCQCNQIGKTAAEWSTRVQKA